MRNEEGNRMRIEQGAEGIVKPKTCLDCLHCKVSAQSTFECRLCFCTFTQKKSKHKDSYWLNKPICKNFFDMTERLLRAVNMQTTTPAKRPPLLKTKWYQQYGLTNSGN